MEKKLLKINAWILIIIGLYILVSNIFPSVIFGFVKYVELFSYCLVSASSIISGIGTLSYLKGKNTYKKCIIFDMIGSTLYCLFRFFVYLKYLFFCNNYINMVFDIKLEIIVIFIFVGPFIFNIIGLYKHKNNNLNQK